MGCTPRQWRANALSPENGLRFDSHRLSCCGHGITFFRGRPWGCFLCLQGQEFGHAPPPILAAQGARPLRAQYAVDACHYCVSSVPSRLRAYCQVPSAKTSAFAFYARFRLAIGSLAEDFISDSTPAARRSRSISSKRPDSIDRNRRLIAGTSLRSSHAASVITGQHVRRGPLCCATLLLQTAWCASRRSSNATMGPVSTSNRSITSEPFEVDFVRGSVRRTTFATPDQAEPFGALEP